jgi:hypothetical protein
VNFLCPPFLNYVTVILNDRYECAQFINFKVMSTRLGKTELRPPVF